MNKETRVYALDMNQIPKEYDGIDYTEFTNEEFISLCELQGGVYSLKGFVKAFNVEEVDTFSHVIRIIDVKVSNEW